MDFTYYETIQVLLAIAIMIVAFGVGRLLNQYYR
jgi:hypothetical protein